MMNKLISKSYRANYNSTKKEKNFKLIRPKIREREREREIGSTFRLIVPDKEKIYKHRIIHLRKNQIPKIPKKTIYIYQPNFKVQIHKDNIINH